jgi:hypothetical protein
MVVRADRPAAPRSPPEARLARKIAGLAQDAHALARAGFPAEAGLAEDLARAACRAFALARSHEAVVRPFRIGRGRVFQKLTLVAKPSKPSEPAF